MTEEQLLRQFSAMASDVTSNIRSKITGFNPGERFELLIQNLSEEIAEKYRAEIEDMKIVCTKLSDAVDLAEVVRVKLEEKRKSVKKQDVAISMGKYERKYRGKI